MKFTALVNGKIITVNQKNDIAEALLLIDDKILSVGTTQEIIKQLPKGGTQIDLGGRTVIPGIVDSHVHLELTVNQLENGINVHQPGCDTLEDLFGRIKGAAAKTPKGQWLIATASNMFVDKIAENRFPTRCEFDEICPDHPLIFTSEVHVMIMNSLAIQKLGWTQESLVPKGVMIGRNPQTGELTGVYGEGWNDLSLTPWGYEKLLTALKSGVVKHYVSKGVTSAHELVYSFDGLKAWQQLRNEGALPLRLKFFLTNHELLNIHSLFDCGLEKGFGDQWLSLGGMKLFADGISLHGNLYGVADLKYSQEELDYLIFEAHRRNLQVWIHVCSEEAYNRAVGACKRALELMPSEDARMRIEHSGDAMFLWFSNPKEKLIAMKKWGLVPICTPQFSHAFANYCTPYKSYIRQGFILPYNSDTTGSQPEACNPWHGIWTVVTRKNYCGKVNLPEECLSPMEAIRMVTLWGAWGAFEENTKGSLQPGKLADLVVLGRDPLTCDPDALRDMPVELVLVGGKAKSASDSFKGVLA
jgi:predicted amidohydrolase YtcJ